MGLQFGDVEGALVAEAQVGRLTVPDPALGIEESLITTTKGETS